MANLIMDKELKQQLEETFRRLDEELKELEEIYENADRELYILEKRIRKLRVYRGA